MHMKGIIVIDARAHKSLVAISLRSLTEPRPTFCSLAVALREEWWGFSSATVKVSNLQTWLLVYANSIEDCERNVRDSRIKSPSAFSADFELRGRKRSP